MPARNEALTIRANIEAALACPVVRRVIVVDDGCEDDTAAIARSAGAEVISLGPSSGSKAHALAAGVRASDASHLLFVDADCTGLQARHLTELCEPVLSGRAEMSLGFFDYGWLNWLVLRLPPLTGERIVPRWLWDAVPEHHLDGYTIESRLDEVVGRGRYRTSARIMSGVGHRTKRQKLGYARGLLGTARMYRQLFALLWPVGDIRWRTYWFYLRGLSID